MKMVVSLALSVVLAVTMVAEPMSLAHKEGDCEIACMKAEAQHARTVGSHGTLDKLAATGRLLRHRAKI